MPTKAGAIQIDLELNKKQFDRELNSTERIASNAGDKISSSIKRIGAAVIAAFSVSAIKNFGQNLIEQAAKVNASNAQFTQTFKSLESEARASISEVAKESGILETRLQGTGSQLYAFAKASGMDSADALKMMKTALKTAADSAAYYDRSLEDTAESLRSFLKGNYANDAALGVSATETTRNAAANRMYGQSFMELSEAQKQLVLLDMVQQANAASGAMGQAAREADGWENVTGNLKEAWSQLLASLGQPILQGAVNIVKKLTEWISKLAQWAKAAGQVLGDLFGWSSDNSNQTAKSTAQSVANAEQTANSIADSVNNQNNLTKAVSKTNAEVKRGIASFDKLNVISKSTIGGNAQDNNSTPANTSRNFNTGASNLGNLGGSINMDTSDADSKVAELKKKIQGFFNGVYENSGLKNFVDKVQEGFNRVDTAYINSNLTSIGDDVNEIVKDTAPGVVELNKSVGDFTGSVVGLGATIGGKIAEFTTGGVKKWLDKDKEYITDTTNEITGNLSSGFNDLTPIFDDLGDKAAIFFDAIRPFTEGVIANALSGLTHAFGELGKFFSGGFKDGAEALKNVYFFFMDDFAPNVMGKIEEIKNWLADLWGNISGFFSSAGENISGFFSGIWESITGFFESVGNWFSDTWQYLDSVFHMVVDPWIEIGEKAGSWLFDTVIHPIENFFKGLWENVSGFFQSLWGDIVNIWNGVSDWFNVNVIEPVTGFFNGIWENVSKGAENAWQGIQDAFSGVANWFRDIFSEAWGKVKDVFSSGGEAYDGIKEGMTDTFKNVVNGLIDGINTIISGTFQGLNSALSHIHNVEILGVKPFTYVNPIDVPEIPKLAKGGIAKAPTLAVVGDNPGANNGNPEVISPLNKLQSMIDSSNGEDTVVLSKILEMLKRIYELFVLSRNQGNEYEFVANLNGNDIFREVIRQNELYKKAHNGQGAF